MSMGQLSLHIRLIQNGQRPNSAGVCVIQQLSVFSYDLKTGSMKALQAVWPPRDNGLDCNHKSRIHTYEEGPDGRIQAVCKG